MNTVIDPTRVVSILGADPAAIYRDMTADQLSYAVRHGRPLARKYATAEMQTRSS